MMAAKKRTKNPEQWKATKRSYISIYGKILEEKSVPFSIKLFAYILYFYR